MMQPKKEADGRTVLVVDDEKSKVAASVKEALQKAGKDVQVVDGAQKIPVNPYEGLPILADETSKEELSAEAQLAALPDEVPDPDLKAMPPFNIPNRSRAEPIVEKLYGPTARLRFPKKEHAGNVQIVRQDGHRSIVLRQAPNLNDLLAEPVESYIKGGRDLSETESRIKSLEFPVKAFQGLFPVTTLNITLGEMAWRACSQFPEFKVKRQREYDKYRNNLRRSIESQKLENLAANAKKQIAEMKAQLAG